MAHVSPNRANLSIEQRIRAMHRKYNKHKIHLVDDALQRHAGDLEGYLTKLVSRWGEEPTLLYSYDVFPELLPASSSSYQSSGKIWTTAKRSGNSHRQDAYTNVTLGRLLELGSPLPNEEGFDDGPTGNGDYHYYNHSSSSPGKRPTHSAANRAERDAGYFSIFEGEGDDEDAGNSSKRSRKFGKGKVSKGDIDEELEREGLRAQEHKARAKVKNEVRQWFFKLSLEFSDKRALIQQREHNERLKEAVLNEEIEERERIHKIRIQKEQKARKVHQETQINALVHLESKERAEIFQDSVQVFSQIRKRAANSLNNCQRAAARQARIKAQKRKQQIDGNGPLTSSDDDEDDYSLSPVKVVDDGTEEVNEDQRHINLRSVAEDGAKAPLITKAKSAKSKRKERCTRDPSSFGLPVDDPVAILIAHSALAADASSPAGKRKANKKRGQNTGEGTSVEENDKKQEEVLLLMDTSLSTTTTTPTGKLLGSSLKKKSTLFDMSLRKKQNDAALDATLRTSSKPHQKSAQSLSCTTTVVVDEGPEFSRDDCAPIASDLRGELERRKEEQARESKLKMRRLALLNAKQREIISKRMETKRDLRQEEMIAAAHAAAEVQRKLEAVRSGEGLNELRHKKSGNNSSSGARRSRRVR